MPGASSPKWLPLLLQLSTSSLGGGPGHIYCWKREDVNAILNTQRTTASTVFSASNEPTSVTLLPKLPDSHSKPT